MRPLYEQVVVVTGASSGIGRETARELGARGASVVLAARNDEALSEAAMEVERAGGAVEIVPTDVSDWNEVERLAARATERFGRIDAWVNNAGVSVYADIEALTPEEMRRVVEVNLVGVMYGCKAAFEQMKRQPAGGVIVNVSSALARRSVPLQAPYCAAKHGITGFTESVRTELESRYPEIKLVEVLPSSINTPLFAHARSKIGTKPRPIAPIYEPSVVAGAIVRACEQPQREIFAGGAGKVFAVAERLSPPLVDWYLRRNGRGFEDQRAEEPDDGRDNLFEPSRGPGSVNGDWTEEAKPESVYTRTIEIHPGRQLMMAALAGIALMGVGKVGRRALS